MPHTLVTTCHFSDKCLNSMQRFDLDGLANKKIITRTGHENKKFTKV